jgi:putative ABC transport system ATP-binding protein
VTSAAEDPVVVRAENLGKTYARGVEKVVALDGATFTVERGEFVAIVGPSGAGKTTLLQLIGAMDTPTAGRLIVAGRDISRVSDADLTRLRRDHIGFVFQHFGLLPTLTVEENVALPTLMTRRRRATERADLLLERVGLAHRRRHRPHELSGGEMQRVAIARALVNRPDLLLADEPTGNLDSGTGASILGLLRTLRDDGLTVVVVTHNTDLAAAADRRLTLHDGRLTGDGG